MNALRKRFDDRKRNARKEKRGPTFPMHSFAISGNVRGITKYIAEGADLNSRDKQGRTPLHEACCSKEHSNFVISRNSLDMVMVLVNSGANPMAVDNLGDTPLHCVARHKRNREVAAHLVIEVNTRELLLNGSGLRFISLDTPRREAFLHPAFPH